MDEPSAALSDTEIEALFGVIRNLVGDGVQVIYISHRMPEIFTIGDRVTVMRDGRTVGTTKVSETEVAELIGLSDRVAVMHEGALQGILPRAEATQERIMELALQFTA